MPQDQAAHEPLEDLLVRARVASGPSDIDGHHRQAPSAHADVMGLQGLREALLAALLGLELR